MKGENLLSGKTLNDNVPLFAQMFEVNFLYWVLRYFLNQDLFSPPFLPSFSPSLLLLQLLFPFSFSFPQFISISTSTSLVLSLSISAYLSTSLDLSLARSFFFSLLLIFSFLSLISQFILQIGRRYKIMNPGKMRNTYGKLMWIIMDTENHGIKAQLKVWYWFFIETYFLHQNQAFCIFCLLFFDFNYLVYNHIII